MNNDRPWTRQHSIALSAIMLLTLIRVASTHRVFSPTIDEPIHVAAGYEYLTQHQYRLDPEHPPLARALFALPFCRVVTPLDFKHRNAPASLWERGNALYTSAGTYMRGVAQSRRANLFLLVVALIATAAWASDLFGPTAGVVAATIVALQPPVLAHAGLATTDVSGLAAYGTAMAALHRWLDKPTWVNTGFFGIGMAFGIVSKFSFLPFFAASALIILLADRRCHFGRALAAVSVAFVVSWAAYGFEVGRVDAVDPAAAQIATAQLGVPSFISTTPLPAPSWIVGLIQIAIHNRNGHPAFLFGRVSNSGWWYYFPVAFALKTPIPLMLLAAAGAWLLVRHRKGRHVIAIAVAIMAVAMTSHINIGVRHVLPIYAPLSIIAAYALVHLWRRPWLRTFAALLCAWLFIDSAMAHPDYLPWANALAGGDVETILADSNFDWGQDLVRLRTECRRSGVHDLGILLFSTADLPALGLPSTHSIRRYEASSGWIAVSETAVRMAQAQDPLAFVWLTGNYGFRRVGKTVRLYQLR